MNYLQMVQRLQRECGVSGNPIATVIGNTGEPARLCDWINTAWMDIQLSHDNWQFMRQPFSFNTTAMKQSYSPSDTGLSNFDNWKRDSFRVFRPALGYGDEMIMPFTGFDEFRNLYEFGNMRLTYQRPVLFSIDPQKAIVLGPIPDGIYTVTGEYFLLPSEMAANTDIPVLPVQYHMAIVYRAMTHYGAYEAASEVLQRGEDEFRRMMMRVNADQLPKLEYGAPLA